MEKQTLLFYINSINRGGAERVILQLARHFADTGYRSVLVTSFVDAGNEYDVPQNVTRISMEQVQLNQSKLMRNVSRVKKLRNICKEEKPAAVISFMAEPNFRSLVATRGLNAKTIISVRNDPKRTYAGKVGRFIGRYLLPMADGCVFQTEEAKAWFPERLQKKSKVILNDVKEEFFRIDRTETKHVVALGRLSEQKNHALLIRAFAKIADKHPEENLLIYGRGSLREGLADLIHSLNMDNRIKLMGTTKDAASVLKNARVFVLSSDYEGMPNCLMEALAAGVPCVSTDCPCGGPRTLIRDGTNGLLVSVGDLQALSDGIDFMLSHKHDADMMGATAKKMSEEFHPDRVFGQWKSYVEKIINREHTDAHS